ncbi:MAG: class I SAM-dependent methyltransferase [Lachnospiraceae bacterium]|nr:class I SAM-dependent methyltransferase [Lachnospiraceae bacterium]
MDSTKNFDGLATEYAVGRPTYAKAFIEDLYSRFGFSERSIIADIGSGTGKFALQLLEKGSFVYCVEPNDDMRSTAINELGAFEKFYAVKGTDKKTNIPENAVDFITTAQAFHWFDVVAFQKECKRILKQGGLVFLIWNLRDMSDEMNRKCFEIYSEYCPRFKGFGGGIRKDDIRIRQFFEGDYECLEYDNPLYYDKETFISRSLSGSYSLQEGDADFSKYVEALLRLFDAYAKDGVLHMANKTVVYVGK